jgi:hypothetical protein
LPLPRFVVWRPRRSGRRRKQLRPNFYLIAGAGGNVVMQTGPIDADHV